MYDYGARWYDPQLGRFISPDTIVPNPGNPQDLNRFSYVRNNPINYVDPSGHRTCSPDQAATGDETCNQNIEYGFDDYLYSMWQTGASQHWSFNDYRSAFINALGQIGGGDFYELSGAVADTLYYEGGPAWGDIQVSTYILLNADALMQYAQQHNFMTAAVLLGSIAGYTQQSLVDGSGPSSVVLPGEEYKYNLEYPVPIKDSATRSYVNDTLTRINRGGPFPYPQDGATFGNRENLLPNRDYGYYTEYTVAPLNATHRGKMRLVTGLGGEVYFTHNHYHSFVRIK